MSTALERMYHTDVVLKYSANVLSQGTPLNVATVPGTMISDCAKMIGITPALLMRSGMKVFCPSRMRPRPITLRGIWTGIRRAATVMATVPATTSTMMNSTMSSTAKLSVPVFNASNVFTVSGRIRSMIEKKMSRLMPFPMPRSVICSPSHMTKTPPVVRVSTVVIRKPHPGCATALGSCSVKMPNPYAWKRQSTTVT